MVNRHTTAWLNATKCYLGGWGPGDLAISSADVFDSLYIVRVVVPREYENSPGDFHDYGAGVDYEIVDNSLWGWNTDGGFPKKDVGSLSSCHHSNLHRNIEPIIEKYLGPQAWNGARETDNIVALQIILQHSIWPRLREWGLAGSIVIEGILEHPIFAVPISEVSRERQ